MIIYKFYLELNPHFQFKWLNWCQSPRCQKYGPGLMIFDPVKANVRGHAKKLKSYKLFQLVKINRHIIMINTYLGSAFLFFLQQFELGEQPFHSWEEIEPLTKPRSSQWRSLNKINTPFQLLAICIYILHCNTLFITPPNIFWFH